MRGIISLADFATRRGWRTIAVDLRGFGETELSARSEKSMFSLREAVGDVSAVLGAVGNPNAYFIGHDWGSCCKSTSIIKSSMRQSYCISVPYK